MLIRAGISLHDSPVGGRESRLLTSGAIGALQSVKFQFLHQSFAGQAQKNSSCESNIDACQAGVPATESRRKGNNFCQAHVKFATVLSKHSSLPAPHFRKDPAPQTRMRLPGCIHVLGFHPTPALGPPFYPVCTQT